MKNQTFALFGVIILFGLLTACVPAGTTLTGSEQQAVLTFSEAKTDNLLAGMNAGDYAAFSKDFDQEMLNAIPQAQFDVLKKDRDDKLGAYISRQVKNVMQQDDFYVVFYDAEFKKDKAVTIRVVFRIAEPHQVSGLWFDK